MNIIDKENYKKRLNICFNCPSYQPSYKKCKECGCFLLIKAAAKIFKCPLNKRPVDES